MPEVSKLAIILNHSRLTHFYGLLVILIVAEVGSVFVNGDVNDPASTVFVPKDSRHPRFTIGPHSLVLYILRLTADTKIIHAVVEGVVVPMISKSAIVICQSQKLSVHFNQCFSCLFSSTCIKRLSTFRPFDAPIPLHEPFVLDSIYDCVLALRERDEADSLIERLDHLMAFHGAFHKEPHIPCATVQPPFILQRNLSGG